MNTGQEAGFTVIEALIATAIVAVIVAALYQVTATNAGVARKVGDRRMALLVAQSALDLATVQGDRPSARRGGTAGFLWRTSTTPYSGGGLVDSGTRIDRIDVRVFRTGTDKPLVTLQTLAMRP